MGWTTPRTWVATNTLTAAQLNTDVRDNMQALSGDGANGRPSCRVYNSANISHTTSGTTQALTFDSERWDTQSMHSTSSNTSRISIPSGWNGVYLIGGSIEWAASTSGNYRSLGLRINGSTFIAQNTWGETATTGVAQMTVMALWKFTSAGTDYVELMANQNSGGALNVSFSAGVSPEFFAIWMGV